VNIFTITSSGQTVLPQGAYLSPGDRLLEELPASAIIDQCSPSPLAAVAYFCTFVILCGLILVNFVIGIIIENMSSSSTSEDLPVSEFHLVQFAEVSSHMFEQPKTY
jgi:hypothetical protein